VPEDARIVVRGDDVDPAISGHQAERFLQRFKDWGRYGLSGYYARNDAEVNDLAADHLERFPLLGIFGIRELEEAGFEVVPTFRSPHVTIAFAGDLTEALTRLTELRIELRPNPYHDVER
ncbi:MAG: hypothetical protein ACRDZ3_16140, partial [Acidimicrobiia bacterium]